MSLSRDDREGQSANQVFYDRLLAEKDARIKELTTALEHERQQSRLHAEAYAKAIERIPTASQNRKEGLTLPQQSKQRGSSWLAGMLGNWVGNLLTPATLGLLSILALTIKNNQSYLHHVSPSVLLYDWFLHLTTLCAACALVMNFFTSRIFINPEKPFVPKRIHVLWEQVFMFGWYASMFIAMSALTVHSLPLHHFVNWFLLFSLPFILRNALVKLKFIRTLLKQTK